MESNLNVNLSNALDIINQGNLQDDGSVSVSKENIEELVKKGLLVQSDDGSFRLNVDSTDLQKALKSTNTVSISNNTVIKDDTISSATSSTLSPTSNMSKVAQSAIKALNQSPEDPSINASSNPYFSSSIAAQTRVALTSLFAIQMQIASKMQEHNLAMTKMIAKSALSTARGIQMAGEGEQFGQMMSAVASTTAATSLLTGAILQSSAKLDEAKDRYKAKMLRENAGQSTAVGMIIDDDDDDNSSMGSRHISEDDSKSSSDYEYAEEDLRLDTPNRNRRVSGDVLYEDGIEQNVDYEEGIEQSVDGDDFIDISSQSTRRTISSNEVMQETDITDPRKDPVTGRTIIGEDGVLRSQERSPTIFEQLKIVGRKKKDKSKNLGAVNDDGNPDTRGKAIKGKTSSEILGDDMFRYDDDNDNYSSRFLSIDLEEQGGGGSSDPYISRTGSKQINPDDLLKEQKRQDILRAIRHEYKADVSSNRAVLAGNLGRVHENMAMAIKHAALMIANKITTSGKIQEALSSTGEKLSEKAASSSTADLRQALENANKLLQLISSQAQAETDVSSKIIRG